MDYAYRAQGSNNDQLIDKLKAYHIVKSPAVYQAMKMVDRGDFSADKSEAYQDHPHSIGHGATISAPHMHAMCAEILEDYVTRPNARILDVGSGSGYLSAVFARMAKDSAKVIGIEYVPDLVDFALNNFKKNSKDLLETGKVQIKVGDGWKGDPNNGPFDAIHVGAAAESMPKALVEQLKNGGRMIIPVGKYNQNLIQVDKHADGSVTQEVITPVRYVPLVKTAQ